MDVEILHDKTLILNSLRKNAGLHIYEIGDLDDFFWPKTIWFALTDKDIILSIALLYIGMETPTLLLFHEGERHSSMQLLKRIRTVLPVKFYAHLSDGLKDVFGIESVLETYGTHYKMVLGKVVERPDDEHIRKLSVLDLPVVKDFYSISYPNNWFDSRMLETNKYYGYFMDNMLVGIAGVHVYSGEYKIAALGNIATHPDYRGQQIGYKVTSAICYDLQKYTDLIGLNVKSNNEFAIRCYKKIGFETINKFDEYCIRNG